LKRGGNAYKTHKLYHKGRKRRLKIEKGIFKKQGRIQEFCQGGLNIFFFTGGGLSTRWGLKTP